MTELEGKRVVFVVAWAVMGGTERNALQMLLHLAEKERAFVEVLALTGEDGRFRKAVEESGIRWHAYPVHWFGGKRYKARTLGRLALRLKRLRPDVLMPYTTRPNVLCGVVWRATGASLLVWNQRDLSVSTKFSNGLVSRAARASPLLLANSQVGADFLVTKLGAPPKRVHVVRDGVRLAAPAADRTRWRERLGIDEDTVVVTMLAHFHRGKDHKTLLRAWQQVNVRAEGKAILVLAGRPVSTEEEAKALAYDLELGRSVRFLGDVDDVSGLLAASDIGVLSSRSESAPRAVLECMAAGLPVAGTDVPGIREMIPRDDDSLLAGPGDADALARALLELIENPDLRHKSGRENQRRALARNSKPAAEQVTQLLTTVVGSAPSK